MFNRIPQFIYHIVNSKGNPKIREMKFAHRLCEERLSLSYLFLYKTRKRINQSIQENAVEIFGTIDKFDASHISRPSSIFRIFLIEKKDYVTFWTILR